tara:strand:- start:1181 stop:1807 length:627 start_codon:yes stop_codon:yes gene_type:complete
MSITTTTSIFNCDALGYGLRAGNRPNDNLIFTAGERRAFMKFRLDLYEDSDSWTNTTGWSRPESTPGVGSGTQFVDEIKLGKDEINSAQFGQDIEDENSIVTTWNATDVRWEQADVNWEGSTLQRDGVRSEVVAAMYIYNKGPGNALISMDGSTGAFNLKLLPLEGLTFRGSQDGDTIDANNVFVKPQTPNDADNAIEVQFLILRSPV